MRTSKKLIAAACTGAVLLMSGTAQVHAAPPPVVAHASSQGLAHASAQGLAHSAPQGLGGAGAAGGGSAAATPSSAAAAPSSNGAASSSGAKSASRTARFVKFAFVVTWAMVAAHVISKCRKDASKCARPNQDE